MAMIEKNILLTNQQAEWIQSKIAGGNYGNESEVLRELIQKEQDRDSEIEAIRTALIEGEKSGLSQLTPDQIFAEAKEHLKKNGKI